MDMQAAGMQLHRLEMRRFNSQIREQTLAAADGSDKQGY